MLTRCWERSAVMVGGLEKIMTKEEQRQNALKLIWNLAPAKARERSSREECRRALRLSKTHLGNTAAIVASLRLWKASEDWTRDGGKYIPGLHRWLRVRKWEDIPVSTHVAEARRNAAVRPRVTEEDICNWKANASVKNPNAKSREYFQKKLDAMNKPDFAAAEMGIAQGRAVENSERIEP